MFSVLRIIQGEPVVPCSERPAVVSVTRKHIRSVELLAGLCPQVRLPQKYESCDKEKLVSQSPIHSTSFARHQCHGCSVDEVEARKYFSPERECECHRRGSAGGVSDFSLVAPTSIVVSMCETRRSRRSPRVPQTPSKRPLQNCPESVLLTCPHLTEIVRSIDTFHFDKRRIGMTV